MGERERIGGLLLHGLHSMAEAHPDNWRDATGTAIVPA